MKIGDRVYVHGYVDEIRKDTVIIRNEGGYFGTVKSEIIEAQKPEDIVNVVRCKDCRFSDVANLKDRYGQSHPVPCCRAEGNFRMGITPDEYCSRAERKEE